MKVTIISIVIGAFGTVNKGLLKGLEDLEIRGRVETIQTIALLNTEKSPGDLRTLAVTHTQVENHQLTLKWVKAPVLENDSHKLLWDFDIQTDHLIPAKRPDLIIINKKRKKKICKIVDFVVPANHRINLKEREKKDKSPDLARELKKLWNMKVTIVPIVIGALGTITKGLLKGLEDLEVGGRVETIQMIAMLRTARILRWVLETWGDLL